MHLEAGRDFEDCINDGGNDVKSYRKVHKSFSLLDGTALVVSRCSSCLFYVSSAAATATVSVACLRTKGPPSRMKLLQRRQWISTGNGEEVERTVANITTEAF